MRTATNSGPETANWNRDDLGDWVVSACGLVTCVLTALLLWFVESQWGFAFYSLTFWFVLPVGALLSGFGGASGYYAGARLLNRRPTRLLLINVLLISVVTFFLVNYLSYITFDVEGLAVSDIVPFTQYLDIAIRATSMEFSVKGQGVGGTGELGALGYGVAAIQILGFAAGGAAVYFSLGSLLYCGKCSRYFASKAHHARYSDDIEAIDEVSEAILNGLENSDVSRALQQHSGFGKSSEKGAFFVTELQVRNCPKCGRHWVKYSISKRSGSNWVEIEGVGAEGFITDVVGS